MGTGPYLSIILLTPPNPPPLLFGSSISTASIGASFVSMREGSENVL